MFVSGERVWGMQKAIVYTAGLDIGSTTAKITLLDQDERSVFADYRRHHADILGTAASFFQSILSQLGDARLVLRLTGSAGLGVSKLLHLPFVQEVVAAVRVVDRKYPDVSAAMDIGGEDAKMIFFEKNRPPDIRMNGSCAGGTGSFIDQMAALMNTTPFRLNALAGEARHIYPVASRCGVFAKTDVQNMFSRKVPHADIAASVFHAVALQCINSLARGIRIRPRMLLCGGVLTFLPELVRRLEDLLGFSQNDFLIPERAEMIPAMGAALADSPGTEAVKVSAILQQLGSAARKGHADKGRLSPLFRSRRHFRDWHLRSRGVSLPATPVSQYRGRTCFLGIDSGSTTTKIVVMGRDKELLHTWYRNNDGDPVAAALEGLGTFRARLAAAGSGLTIARTAVTGYGEDLIRAALGMDDGLVETMAHVTAAREINPDVTFLLDIGGQDMKAVFIRNGIVRRIELNEACSSGCGSFLEALAASLDLPVSEFARKACEAAAPCDLGTRCTVFMNSKIKQSLREQASIPDISAGLAYSVVKNCLFKVLKLHAMADLGDHIVLQGGTFRNPAIVRALEVLTGKRVAYSRTPELMGAFGAALAARTAWEKDRATCFPGLDALEAAARHTTDQLFCKGCDNGCRVTQYRFASGRTFFSGNRCERHFGARGKERERGFDFLAFKTDLLFNRPETGRPDRPTGQALDQTRCPAPVLTLGLPRALGMYEHYPFWHTLFSRSGIRVLLSPPSTDDISEKGMGTVMSDNICFPAKLVHGHIRVLAEMGADRIFLPRVFYEKKEFPDALNAFNCPVVSSYADVIQSAVDPLERYGIPLDGPVIRFDDASLLQQAVFNYLEGLGIRRRLMSPALSAALDAQAEVRETIRTRAGRIMGQAEAAGRLLIVLAGRPYHADPLVNHGIAGILTGLGADIVTEAGIPVNGAGFENVRVVTQWAYPNRIYHAADWVASQGPMVQMVLINSFGCGPDAVVIDEVRELLEAGGKPLTLIKVDEMSSPGSVRLRLRSMIASLAASPESAAGPAGRSAPSVRRPFVRFGRQDRDRTIWAPYFSEDYAPYLPAVLKNAGYRFNILPRPDKRSVELGLQFASNDICYPGTIVIGDIIKALRTKQFKPDEIAIGITQTGGQCRASNYISLIRKAMIRAGFEDIPLVSVAASRGIIDQPGFRIRWLKKTRLLAVTTLYADSIAKMYYASAPREKIPGQSQKIRAHYISRVGPAVARADYSRIFRLLHGAVADFNAAAESRRDLPRMGVVGEIYAKYNYFPNQNLVHWLISRGIEPVLPPILDYFIQDLVNFRENIRSGLRHRKLTDLLAAPIEGLVNYYRKKVNRILSGFNHALLFDNIHDTAGNAAGILSLTNQFGEGWLIPGEIAMFARSGIRHVISVQPFGCIANHIVSKGVERRIRSLYPETALYFLDFDPGMSEANVRNRLHFMVDRL